MLLCAPSRLNSKHKTEGAKVSNTSPGPNSPTARHNGDHTQWSRNGKTSRLNHGEGEKGHDVCNLLYFAPHPPLTHSNGIYHMYLFRVSSCSYVGWYKIISSLFWYWICGHFEEEKILLTCKTTPVLFKKCSCCFVSGSLCLFFHSLWLFLVRERGSKERKVLVFLLSTHPMGIWATQTLDASWWMRGKKKIVSFEWLPAEYVESQVWLLQTFVPSL